MIYPYPSLFRSLRGYIGKKGYQVSRVPRDDILNNNLPLALAMKIVGLPALGNYAFITTEFVLRDWHRNRNKFGNLPAPEQRFAIK